MSCVLRIEGKLFRVDEFLAESKLNPYNIYRLGDVSKFDKTGKSQSETSGCSFDLSKADFSDFDQQIKDSINFLNKNYNELKSVFSFGLKKDEIPVIDFGIESRMHEVEVQCDYLEPELLKLAGNLNFGIEISQYHTSEH
ncbi:hypothetical protein K6119_10795 [Paracrocinitomix mangrovi]|uniref:hypothetical protein n=1 Tax=Paracrocinitomix mangrovi TaxID=2862509 RepID=UPI001C8E08A8|nr:hypothetical protein [Paracrocinitomix mangrovi]UKN00220.1 hypothetical protein K6119_10795 [Paracrocinitomix mangrovi]